MNTKVSVKTGIIYLITFPNSKVYVGLSTKTLTQTIARYVKEAKSVKRPVANALRKYGIENCNFEIITKLFDCTVEKLCEKEIEKIKEYRSNVRGIGYNLKLGGQFGSQLHSDTNRKIGLKAKERLKDKTKHPLWGKHHSTETKLKLSLVHKGRKHAKIKPDLTRKQLLEWFEIGKSFRWAEKFYNVSQVKLEASLFTHFNTTSLEQALNEWRKTLKGFKHKGANRKFLSLQQLEKVFTEGMSSRSFYKKFNFNQRALQRELNFHFGTKSWVKATEIWKRNLQE